jgi:DNA (cytosine-5)-methyltransferase 1
MLKALKPRGFIFENVIGFADAIKITDGRPKPLLDWVLREAMEAGYAVGWGVMDAADYGVPQHRERFIILGSAGEHAPAFPSPTHGSRGIEAYRTLNDAFEGLDSKTTHDLGCMQFSLAKKEILRLVPKGGNWRDLPSGMMLIAMGELALRWGGKTGYWRRLSSDRGGR